MWRLNMISRRPARARGHASRMRRSDGRLVFVVGAPRSGTSFLGDALGELPGFLDLGEAPPLKALLPKLPMPSGGSIAAEAVAGAWIRQVLERVRVFGFARHLRCVEHTPEMAFFVRAAARGYPDARWIHLVRDGRDVACSLLEQGWLGAGRERRAGGGLAPALHRPFWVEPERTAEFERASQATKAAWAWRAYVAAARSAGPEGLAIRYEEMAADPLAIAAVIANHLEIPSAPLAACLTRLHARSVGRFRRDLDAAGLRDVEHEAGGLLRELGYTSGADGAQGADRG